MMGMGKETVEIKGEGEEQWDVMETVVMRGGKQGWDEKQWR